MRLGWYVDDSIFHNCGGVFVCSPVCRGFVAAIIRVRRHGETFHNILDIHLDRFSFEECAFCAIECVLRLFVNGNNIALDFLNRVRYAVDLFLDLSGLCKRFFGNDNRIFYIRLDERLSVALNRFRHARQRYRVAVWVVGVFNILDDTVNDPQAPFGYHECDFVVHP